MAVTARPRRLISSFSRYISVNTHMPQMRIDNRVFQYVSDANQNNFKHKNRVRVIVKQYRIL